MPLFVWVDVDVSSCLACATALKKLGDSIADTARSFTDSEARSNEEWSAGAGGENFRSTVGTVRKLSDRISEVSETVGTAVGVFATDMMTVQAKMNTAVEIAATAKLAITFAGSYAEWIGDPKPRIVGPLTDTAEARFQLTHATQVDAYSQALELVTEARKLEDSAHTALRKATNENQSLLVGVVEQLEKQAPWLWMSAQGVAGTIGEAAKRYDTWNEIARTRAANVSAYRSIALETVSDSYRTAAINSMMKFAGGANQAEAVAAFNAKLAGGNPDSRIARSMTLSLVNDVEISRLPTSVSNIGKALPVAGGILAVLQTGYEVYAEAENSDDVSRIVTRNTGGYVAGAAATALLASGTIGAPVLVAVGAGLLVSYGATTMINAVLD
ncbi:hypothetical protein ABH922_003655 [Rhodococcus sp. 27YEA15]|uniref:hypothetical protein n=1 Tax=Rhodococcus sp. 27YEA15 TaxID=3156259 RepID=UPI003C7C1D0C